jgi:hypothetical protein
MGTSPTKKSTASSARSLMYRWDPRSVYVTCWLILVGLSVVS